ncbi:unnamed protein product [Brassica napus]|uniref:(rape) hypothetical protein n=1 Tax=Brassica napus TaxID=3708 RepID=A0A816YW69_BRANA|nr:unnamed protein product [Brassica napus]
MVLYFRVENRKVYYASHHLHFYQKMQAKKSVFSFMTRSVALSKHLVETTNYFSIAVSFGESQNSFEEASLISMPCLMSHASIPAAVGLTEDLVRISAGIEDADDLISYLDIA